MSRKYFKIDGTKGEVIRKSEITEMQYFWGMVATKDGVKELSQDNPNPQFLQIMVVKNCALHIFVEKHETLASYEPFVGTVILVFSEEGHDKLTVFVVERDKMGFVDSLYFKMQYQEREKMIALANSMTDFWIKGTENKMLEQAKMLFLETKD